MKKKKIVKLIAHSVSLGKKGARPVMREKEHHNIKFSPSRRIPTEDYPTVTENTHTSNRILKPKSKNVL